MAPVDAAVIAGQQQTEAAVGAQAGPGATWSGPSRDILLQVPGVEVHKVEGKQESLLARAPLVAYAVVYPTGERRLALEVGEVRWWLLTDTASLKVAPLTYMMTLPGGQVFHSVTFAEDTPPEAVGAFEALLQEVTVYRKSEALMADPALAEGDQAIAEGLQRLKFQNKLASRIHSVSMKVADGILLASTYASTKLAEQGAAAQARMGAATTEPRPVGGAIKRTASGARVGAKMVADVADKVVNAAAAVPVYVVEKLGKRNKPEEPGKPQGARKQVVTASAVSFTVVWTALESGARVVLTGARDSASGLVNHKYGPDAAAVASDTMTAGGHMANAYTSYRNIAVKAILRKTARATAKQMLANYMGKATPNGMNPKEAAKLSVRERLDAITARGGATIAPNAAGEPSDAHSRMLQHASSRGLMMPPAVTDTPPPHAEAPPAVAQKLVNVN